MLYVTTREKHDAYTAPRSVRNDRGPDGGLYLPFRMPQLDREQLLALQGKSYGQTVAEILNLFFSCRLTAWDVELCTGRYPLRTTNVNRKIVIGEMWHNMDWDYQRLERVLSQRVCQSLREEPVMSSWLRIAVRIASLFALYGEMLKNELIKPDQTFDVAAPAGDFSVPATVMYAREMGLPVTNILCACNDNGGAWELMNHGSFRTDAQIVKTVTPLADCALPSELERLIFAALGVEETRQYCNCCQRGETYTLRPDLLEKLRSGFFTAVVSSLRVSALIASEYNTSGYIMGPYCALAYGGLMDYRAKKAESRVVVILSERSPVCDAELVADSLGVSAEELKRLTEM